MTRKSNDIRRISVALDDDTYNLLKELAEERNATVSDIVRSAISSYHELNTDRDIDVDQLIRYGELLYGGENVIVDIEMWSCILDELNENGSEEIWEQIEKIGAEYGMQYKNMGLVDVKETLDYLEIGNWYKLKTNGDKGCTLILRTQNEEKLLKIFLENMFEAQDVPVDIMEGLRKLIIYNKN
ncbi:MAG: ribbon-helix-helix protein, CopG family [Archaeoglobaceae archaeon]